MATAKTAVKKVMKKTAPKVAPKKATKTSSVEDFAVLKTGGKQYRVSVGDTITIEKLNDTLVKGDTVSFEEVLMTVTGSTIVVGTPLVAKAKVTGEITLVGRAPKVMVIKYKQKSRYIKRNGHRQPLMKVKITSL